MGELITIHDDNYIEHMHYVGPDRALRRKGLVPRDLTKFPPGCMAAVGTTFPWDLIPESEWAGRIAEQAAKQTSVQHIRDIGNNGQPIPSYDQNGKGYCWAHSSTSAVTMLRAVNGEPYVPMSAYAVACVIKSYRDEGGFGGESLQFIADKGIPSSQFWPMQSMSSKNDNPNTWANAATHKCIQWVECDQNATTRRQQVATALLLGFPVIVDYNWWSHSVCAIRLMDAQTVRILNSWGDSWSQNGVGDLQGSKAWPDDAWVPLVEQASQT